MKLIKGDTLEKQMGHVDRILKSYSHRLHKTVTGVITPFPISGYAEVPIDGVVFRYMFPLNGKITIGGMLVESMPKKGIDITTTIHRGDKSESRDFFSKRKSIMIEPDVKVAAGDRLVIEVSPIDPEETVSGIWTAFMWVPNVEDAEIKQIMLNKVLDGEEEEV